MGPNRGLGQLLALGLTGCKGDKSVISQLQFHQCRPFKARSKEARERKRQRDKESVARFLEAMERLNQRWHHHLEDENSKTQGLKPGDKGYERTFRELNEFAEKGEVKKCQELFEILRPNVDGRKTILYNTVLKAYAEAGELMGAESWYNSMVEQSVRINEKTFGKVASAAAKIGRPSDVERWHYEGLQHFGHNIATYGMMIEAFARVGDLEQAEHWFSKLCATGLTPTATHYGALLYACSNASDAAKAKKWFRHMEAGCITPNIKHYQEVIRANGKAKQARSAENWFQEMIRREIQPDALVLNVMIDASAKESLWAGALVWLEAFSRWSLSPTRSSFNSTMNAAARRSQWQVATHIVICARAQSIDPDVVTFGNLIAAYANSRQVSKAEETLQTMMKASISPNVASFAPLFRAYGNNIIKARQCLSKMYECNVSPDGRFVSTLKKVLSKKSMQELGKHFTLDADSTHDVLRQEMLNMKLQEKLAARKKLP